MLSSQQFPANSRHTLAHKPITTIIVKSVLSMFQIQVQAWPLRTWSSVHNTWNITIHQIIVLCIYNFHWLTFQKHHMCWRVWGDQMKCSWPVEVRGGSESPGYWDKLSDNIDWCWTLALYSYLSKIQKEIKDFYTQQFKTKSKLI